VKPSALQWDLQSSRNLHQHPHAKHKDDYGFQTSESESCTQAQSVFTWHYFILQ